MGAGKTTTGRQLAKQLELTFVDSDKEIEARTGVDIPLIFELEGESGFRKREKQMIDELTQRDNIVLATGGGAILDADNRAKLASRGTVIYLSTSIETQLQRTARDKNRPLLQTEDPRQRLESMIVIRNPLYEEVADIVVTTDNRQVRGLIKEILKELKET